MNNSEPIWFYTIGGQQEGPVTLAELKSKASSGTLNPRHDMVWNQGMKDWQPAGEVEGIFERRAQAPPPVPAATAAASADPYEPPVTESADAETLRQATWPGARRRSYIFVAIVLPLILQLGAAMMMPLVAHNSEAPESTALMLLVAMLLMAVLIIYIGVQRLANVGMSRWWYLGNFVPILNLWIGYRMLACPAGYAYHKKLDGAGIALAILYWGLILLSILIVVGLIVIMAGAAGSPELQQQIEQFLREIEQSSGQ